MKWLVGFSVCIAAGLLLLLAGRARAFQVETTTTTTSLVPRYSRTPTANGATISQSPQRTKTRTRSSLSLHASKQNKSENGTRRPSSDSPFSLLSLLPDLFLRTRLSKGLVTASVVLSISLSTISFISPPPAVASSYTALTDEQKVVAEAWRLVDNSFLDRTFNGQDWFQLRQKYVQKKYKNADEAHNAIDEMVSTLGDKYTRYLSPAKYRSLVDSATGTLGGAGVGVQISINDKGQLFASDVEPDSPAKQAGIKPGDVFIEVDGTRFVDDANATPDDVAARLRGPEGSKVGVVMMSGSGKGQGETLDFRITRKPIKITAVQSYMGSNINGVSGKVGVVRIKNFSSTTASTVTQALKELKAKGAANFVLDVRGNPGGLLPGGVDTAQLFLQTNDPIVFVVNKKGVVDAQAALATGMETESPVVVLVDSQTASAAEVFTAALQENGRATVAGEQTFGKGIVQTIRELSDNNGGVAITVARYETPQHHDINKQGIPVNVATSVSCPKDDATACLDAKVFRTNKG